MDVQRVSSSGQVPLTAVVVAIFVWIAVIFVNGVSQTLFLLVSSVLLLALALVLYSTFILDDT
jgi:hypothetical protein